MTIKTYFGALISLYLVPESWVFAVTKELDVEFNDEMVTNMVKTQSLYYVARFF